MHDHVSINQQCQQAAQYIAQADGLLITAGAGMGIDSGLPDFRGDQGFWRAYPALGVLGMRFSDIANPKAFRTDPALAWGFYGHRLQLYRRTVPHAGFSALRQIAKAKPQGTFIFTSNVDGQFQQAGFDPSQVAECHGSIHAMQCTADCGQAVWSAVDFAPQVDRHSGRLICALPCCPACGALARPNILLFGDGRWDERPSEKQQGRLMAWLARVERPVVLELGAGTAIPTVRLFGERLGCPLVRVNPGEAQVERACDIGIALGAREGIAGIAAALADQVQA